MGLMLHFGVRLMEEGGQRLAFGFISPDVTGFPSCHPTGHHDRLGQGPGHPQTLRPHGGGRMLPGAADPLPPGAAGPPLPLPRGRGLLPRQARGGPLRHQRPATALRLQMVARNAIAGPPSPSTLAPGGFFGVCCLRFS